MRKGNPKKIKDWNDLVAARRVGDHAQPEDLGRRPLELPGGVGLRAEGSAAATRPRRKDFVKQLFKNVPVLDTGARGSTTTFVQRGIGDVLHLVGERGAAGQEKLGKDQFEIVVPSLSILAEPPVSIVDKVVDRRGTRAVAEAYLEFLWTPEAQAIAAKNYYRPRLDAELAKHAATFPKLELVDIRRLRRLERGAGEALQRQRRVRPDREGKPGGPVSAASPRTRARDGRA